MLEQDSSVFLSVPQTVKTLVALAAGLHNAVMASIYGLKLAPEV